jgi:hypothetical protein
MTWTYDDQDIETKRPMRIFETSYDSAFIQCKKEEAEDDAMKCRIVLTSQNLRISDSLVQYLRTVGS